MSHQRVRLGFQPVCSENASVSTEATKRNPFLVKTLGRFVDWVLVCPEVESGMEAPRESMRLVQAGLEIRLLTKAVVCYAITVMAVGWRARDLALYLEGQTPA